jgi:hypothetical protein
MSRGYLILAQNSGNTDYVRQAYALALSIKNTQSGVNQVAIATNDIVEDRYTKAFDYVVGIPWTDHACNSTWKIENKWKYYYMTPFDETVVLDSDMIFPEDISHWWDVMSSKEMCITDSPKTFRGETIKSTKYRKSFAPNGLPNVHTAFMYFKKTELVGELFKLVQLIFENRERFFYEFMNESRPKSLSGDVAYALAIRILGIENECFSKASIPSFVHMKAHLQNIDETIITEDWTQHIPTYFSSNGSFFIGNYRQQLPFHYQIKDWLTDDIITHLESNFNK